jgi:hypothetical protein
MPLSPKTDAGNSKQNTSTTLFSAAEGGHPAVNIPLSFADLLSSAASDVIDWAPPGRVSSLHDHTHTARAAARGSPTTSSAPASLKDSEPAAAAAAGASSSLPLPTEPWWWTQGVMNGLFSAQSHTDVLLRETKRYRWTGGVTSALSVTGPQPLFLDAGWRASSDTIWSLPNVSEGRSLSKRMTADGQWGAVPLSLWPKSLQARYQSDRVDAVLRADQKLYSANMCVNLFRVSQSSTQRNSQRPALTPPSSSAAALVRSLNDWSRQYLSCLRTGVGLTIKSDLATGINLFAGAAVGTVGGLSASYHIDVLRRVTISVAHHRRDVPSTTDSSPSHLATSSASSSSSSSSPLPGDSPTYACRLKLNAITYEGTVMEWGASIPIAVLMDTVTSLRTDDKKDARRVAGAASSHSATKGMLQRVGDWLREQPITVQCSHSGVGAMIGCRWSNVGRYLPERWFGGSGGDLRVDITAGVVAKRRGTHTGTLVGSGSAEGEGSSSSSLASAKAPPTLSATPSPSSRPVQTLSANTDDSLLGNQTTSSSVMSERRFHSANSTVVLDSGNNLFPAPSKGSVVPKDQNYWTTGRLRNMFVPRDVSFASFFLVSFE